VFCRGVAVQPAHVLRLASRASAVGRHHRWRRVAAESRHPRRAAADQAHHPGRIGPLPTSSSSPSQSTRLCLSISCAAFSRARFACLEERQRESEEWPGAGLFGWFLPHTEGRGRVQKSAGGRGGGGARPRVIHARGLRRAVRRVRDGPPPSVGEEDSLTYLFGVVGT
jgi:hypothetical protein